MNYPGIEPGASCVLDKRDNRYTSNSTELSWPKIEYIPPSQWRSYKVHPPPGPEIYRTDYALQLISFLCYPYSDEERRPKFTNIHKPEPILFPITLSAAAYREPHHSTHQQYYSIKSRHSSRHPNLYSPLIPTDQSNRTVQRVNPHREGLS